MTSPMVEAVRDIPTKNGEGVQMATGDDSGFPFDDRDFDRDGSYSFRTQLDDIAQRHPEFAEHLNFGNFPFRSHTLGRQRRGSDVNPESNPPPGTHESQFRRYADRPFGSRFENFGFPFTRHFEDEPDFYQAQASPPQQQQHQHQQQHPQSHAQQQQQPQYHPNQPEQKQSEPSSPQPTSSDKPPQVPQSQDRGRKQNIQQSNTVDLGQKQDPVDESRGQRSMSAPPENRSTGQRFVSSINIPIHRGGGEMGARTSQPQPETQSQPQPQARPNERVIPIHVEGRDEPVMPKNIHTTFTQPPPQQQQQQQQQPQTERIFGRNPSQFTQFLNKGEPHGMTPEEVFKQQQQQYQKQQQQNYQQQQQQQNQQQEEQVPQQPEHKPPKPSQLDQIQSIQKDVSELMNQVEKFSGKPKDKQYLYLDEMLTRNLIKLDNIETEGKDNIRQARKEAIKCIESCIGILEAKANANAASAEQKADDNMDLEKAAAPNASESQASGEAQQEQAGENVPQPSADLIDSEKQHAMDTEPVTLEVSGVVKSGSVANAEVSPMEVASNEQATATEEQSPGSEQKEVTASEAEMAVTTEETRPKEGSPPKEGEPDVKQEQGKGEAEVAQDSETSQNCEVDVKTEEKKEKKKGKKKEKTEKK